VVLVNFWASWCPPCIKEMPSLQRLQQRLDDQPFTILTINVEEKKYKVWKFVQLINFTLPVLLDPESRTFYAWNSSILPTSFLLDRQGRVRYRVQGDLVWDSDETISLINKLLANLKVRRTSDNDSPQCQSQPGHEHRPESGLHCGPADSALQADMPITSRASLHLSHTEVSAATMPARYPRGDRNCQYHGHTEQARPGESGYH